MFQLSSFTHLPESLKWRCETVDPGTSVAGVIITNPYPIKTHYDVSREKTKPCLAHITGGKLLCPCSVNGMAFRTTCYVGIMDKNRDKLVIPMSSRVGEAVSTIPRGSMVEFTRSKKPKTPLKVWLGTPTDNDQRWVKCLRQGTPHDISEYLCHLWQIRELTEHFGFEFRPSCNAPILDSSKTG